jgi:16S rRNA (guanine527-N7)-methyltransferase
MQLKQKFKNIDLVFDDIFYARCEQYISLLKQWGRVHNLTSAKELEQENIELNIVDSIYPIKFLDSYSCIADVGTGAGYPGMLLAIARPDIRCVLIEPRSKRVAFLRFVTALLGLTNVQIIEKRVEDISDVTYDLITSRAVSNTKLLLELTQKISSADTKYLFYKGSLASSEVQEAQLNNYDIINIGEHRNYLYINNKGKK